MSLRPYQQKCLEKALLTDGLFVLPTGAGKSHIIGALANALGGDVLIVCPRKELVEQNQLKTSHKVVTVHKAHKNQMCADYLIIDEAHLISQKDGSMFRSLIDRSGRTWGFTASPYRMDCGHLTPTIFPSVQYEVTMGQLVDWGALVPLVHKDIPHTHLINVKDMSTVAAISADARPRTKQAVEHFLANYDGNATLVFCCDIEHCMEVAELTGWPVVSGKTPKRERAGLVEQLRAGALGGLINCELFHTGFDYPALSNVLILRPTESYTLYTQMIGRACRTAPNKTQGHVWDYTLSSFNFKAVKTNPMTLCMDCGEETLKAPGRCSLCGGRLYIASTTATGKECQKCQSPNKPRAKYCHACGADLVALNIEAYELDRIEVRRVLSRVVLVIRNQKLDLEIESARMFLKWLGAKDGSGTIEPCIVFVKEDKIIKIKNYRKEYLTMNNKLLY